MKNVLEFKALPQVVQPSADGRTAGHAEAAKQPLEVLQETFGYPAFRGWQEEAIRAALEGRDCLCLMPTGGGKSLCYQVPALCRSGLGIVVSPLIALMENQVDALRRKKVVADFLCSTQPAAVKNKIHEDLTAVKPKLKLLYVTPELVTTEAFQSRLGRLYSRRLLSLFAIDEAHCISAWGHDFRPSYRSLSILRTRYPGVPLMAVTATATQKVRDDIVRSLNLESPVVALTSFNRPNIHYDVVFKENLRMDPVDHLVKWLLKAPSDCAVIYCLQRATCDEIGEGLRRAGLHSEVYHAGLPVQQRTLALERWASGKVPIVVATIAFGMGIDRADVRTVIHWTLPKSLEGFYQESGRAGRDGAPARSILYYSREEKEKMEFIIRQSAQKSAPKEDNRGSNKGSGMGDAALAAFKKVVDYCEATNCRRVRLLAHFGERASPVLCKRTCDACSQPAKLAADLAEMAGAAGERRRVRMEAYGYGMRVTEAERKDPNQESEFWNRKDEGERSDEESISGSEGEAEKRVAAARVASAVSKRSRGKDPEDKLAAWMEAEEEHEKKKARPAPMLGVTEAVREESRKKLRESILKKSRTATPTAGAASSMSEADMARIARVLEARCHAERARKGRGAYNQAVTLYCSKNLGVLRAEAAQMDKGQSPLKPLQRPPGLASALHAKS